jgi:hypothetical protein
VIALSRPAATAGEGELKAPTFSSRRLTRPALFDTPFTLDKPATDARRGPCHFLGLVHWPAGGFRHAALQTQS